MNRSNVMAEGLAGYMDVVNERLVTVKKTVESLQRKAYYTEAFANFEQTVLEEVPEDIATDWTAQLTIKQFNEELKGVFPYIYKLVSEANKVKDLGPEDLLGENEVEPVTVDEDDMSECSCEDPGAEYEQHLDNIISNSKHERDPMQEYQQAFEDFKMAAASAARSGAKEFEYPKGSGKMHPVKMSKDTASKLMSSMEMPMGEDEQVVEFFGALAKKFVGPAINSLKGLGSKAKPGLDALAGAASKGGQTIAKKGAEIGKKVGPGTMAVGQHIGRNKLPYAALGGGAYAYDKAGDVSDAVSQYAGDLADKIPTTQDIQAMMPSIPNASEIAGIAKQYALPAAAVAAVLYGGYKLLGAMFGDDDNESSNEKTIDLSPQGQGDELKDRNETPLDEFIKSYYDYTTNAFPKGETAVITAVQKKYGDEAVNDAANVMNELLHGQDQEMARIQQLAGLR